MHVFSIDETISNQAPRCFNNPWGAGVGRRLLTGGRGKIKCKIKSQTHRIGNPRAQNAFPPHGSQLYPNDSTSANKTTIKCFCSGKLQLKTKTAAKLRIRTAKEKKKTKVLERDSWLDVQGVRQRKILTTRQREVANCKYSTETKTALATPDLTQLAGEQNNTNVCRPAIPNVSNLRAYASNAFESIHEK